jgi:hypothetical protein
MDFSEIEAAQWAAIRFHPDFLRDSADLLPYELLSIFNDR